MRKVYIKVPALLRHQGWLESSDMRFNMHKKLYALFTVFLFLLVPVAFAQPAAPGVGAANGVAVALAAGNEDAAAGNNADGSDSAGSPDSESDGLGSGPGGGAGGIGAGRRNGEEPSVNDDEELVRQWLEQTDAIDDVTEISVPGTSEMLRKDRICTCDEDVQRMLEMVRNHIGFAYGELDSGWYEISQYIQKASHRLNERGMPQMDPAAQASDAAPFAEEQAEQGLGAEEAMRFALVKAAMEWEDHLSAAGAHLARAQQHYIFSLQVLKLLRDAGVLCEYEDEANELIERLAALGGTAIPALHDVVGRHLLTLDEFIAGKVEAQQLWEAYEQGFDEFSATVTETVVLSVLAPETYVFKGLMWVYRTFADARLALGAGVGAAAGVRAGLGLTDDAARGVDDVARAD